MKAPLSTDEEQRLAALGRYAILDTAPEQAFDDLTLLAAHICQVPTAMVSLVDQDRQWFKSKQGIDVTETARNVAFCAHTILHADQVLEVRDARTDPRFADNPLVTGEPYFRFYAGAPLITRDGYALGALCVMDTTPHTLNPAQIAAMQALGRRVVDQLELRRQAQELAKKEGEAARALILADKSRRALLGALEDEQQAMVNLKASEERFREMAATVDQVFWMTDTATNRVLYISPAYEQIWGRGVDELYAAPDNWLSAIVPEDRARVLAATAKQITGGYREEYRIMRPDGSIRWINSRAFPITDADGSVRRIVGVAVDVTERKKLEEQFLRTQRMEAIGTLAGGVAHDLNNILAPVLMVAGLLKLKLKDSHDLALLAMVESSALRGAGIIKQLLMFSRGMSGERVTVQLRHLLKEMVGLMRETFPRDIAIVEKVPGDLWTVTGDVTQLHQVLMNLCVNARDAMPAGGQLMIEGENVVLSEADAAAHAQAHAGPYVRMRVRDTGQGIPLDAMERIFDPFFTTKEVGKGTGLGLSTVLGIVKSHAGFLTVNSDPGHGASFEVYLPANQAEGNAAEPAAPAPMAQGSAEMILVVDDEADIGESTQMLLEMHGYQSLYAANGREAVARFLENQDAIKLVVTDLMMPVMGGVALARVLKKIKPDLRIIAITGLEQESKQAELAELGVTDILVKPCGPAELLAAIRSVLDRT